MRYRYIYIFLKLKEEEEEEEIVLCFNQNILTVFSRPKKKNPGGYRQKI